MLGGVLAAAFIDLPKLYKICGVSAPIPRYLMCWMNGDAACAWGFQPSFATLQNISVEVCYPPEWYRDDVGVLWYADVSMRDGTLSQLVMTPTRLRYVRS